MKRLKKILVFLFAPSAFKLGLVITMSFVGLALYFYATPAHFIQHSTILNIINDAHQKTVDYRLRFRGERPVSNEVALVVVDDKSLEKLGRWPWPRSKMANMVERLRSYGAKVIAFDAVFSEPELNPAMRTLNEIKSSGLTSNELNAIIDQELENNNSDLIFAKAIEKQADHLVMGMYFDPPHMEYNQGYSELCESELAAKETEYHALENEALPVVALDTQSSELNEDMKAYIHSQIEKIKTDALASVSNEKNVDTISLNAQTLRKNLEFCEDWISSYAEAKSKEPRGPASDVDLQSFAYSVLRNSALKSGRWWLNIPMMIQGTKHSGYFNAFPDKDGTIRSANLVVRYGNQYVPSMALKSVMLAKNLGLLLKLDQDPMEPDAKRITSISLTDPETAEEVKNIPVDAQGRMLINYAGSNYSFPHMSVAELFNDKETALVSQRSEGKPHEFEVNKAEWIKDKIFLFGATAIGIYDLRVTPFSENFPGPEIHTNIIDNLLQEDYLLKASTEPTYMLITLTIIGLALSSLISYLGAITGMLISAGSLFIVYFYDKIFLFKNGVVTTIVFPLFLIGVLYIALTFYKYLTEERKKKELRGTFAKYVSPSVVNEILKDPSNIELGGKKQRMTVMFSDVRGFTTISEKLEPTKLGDILNMYLTPMTRLVFDYKGTLDKYMGDAIMAFWGAPISFPDHAIQACHCALKMMIKLKDLNKQFEALNLPHIDIGIGINTGDMSVGNMGSDIVRSYTVMGDSVNLGSRLEGINKEYGTHIIISEFTYQEVKDHFVCREVDWVRVKGKKLPVKIYELIGEKTADQKLKEKIEHFKAGFDFYHEKLWDKALEAFNLTLNVDPNDYTSKLYVKRCMDYKVEPPPEDWDGVFEMKTK